MLDQRAERKDLDDAVEPPARLGSLEQPIEQYQGVFCAGARWGESRLGEEYASQGQLLVLAAVVGGLGTESPGFSPI